MSTIHDPKCLSRNTVVFVISRIYLILSCLEAESLITSLVSEHRISIEYKCLLVCNLSFDDIRLSGYNREIRLNHSIEFKVYEWQKICTIHTKVHRFMDKQDLNCRYLLSKTNIIFLNNYNFLSYC